MPTPGPYEPCPCGSGQKYKFCCVAKAKAIAESSEKTIYTLDVFPTSERLFSKVRKKLRSTIEILGSHTLQDLHYLMYDLGGFDDDHLWEFLIGGKAFYDPANRRYGPPELGHRAAGVADRTTIGSLGLAEGDLFGYHFDFGDEWRFSLQVVTIELTDNRPPRPRITMRAKESSRDADQK